MPIPIDVSFRNIEPSPAIEARIREKAAKLERFFDRGISWKVVVEARHRHQHKGKLYNVRIHLALPGQDLLVGHEHKLDHAHEDVYVAIRDAFDALGRRLQDRVREWQGAVKLHVVPEHGRVAKLFEYEGYGFIEAADGQEIYFHKNAVTDGFDKLEVGDEVRFVMREGESEKGPQASTVTRIGKHHLPPTETTR
jgi:ribosomal subunit interface protein